MPKGVDNVTRIEAIQDPGEQVRAATAQLAISRREVDELSRLRKSTMERMRGEGMSLAQIAEAAGLTRGRVHQILHGGPPAEGRFVGRSPITVAVPLRQLPGRTRPVISSEDTRAYDMLADLLDDLSLEVQRVAIPPDGDWSPPTGSVVAICGPKSSDVTARAIDADPFLSFGPNANGRWTIQDRETGAVYESPVDAADPDHSADVAYVGRLPVGRRSILFIAGVHALGSVGAVDYVARNLPDLYATVGNQRFSMVISSEHDGDTVTRSELVCTARAHE